MTNTAAYSPETCHLQLRKAAKRRCESHFQPALTASPRQDGRCGKGYARLSDVDGAPYEELLALHGVGERGLERLQAALVEAGGSLGGDVPAPEDRAPTVTRTKAPTGKSASDIKTHPTDVGPEEFLATLSERRAAEGERLLEIFGTATGAEPVMWGPSMIGYGNVHYTYATGREGDTFQVGFSPRSAKLSLYGLLGHPRTDELLGKLGPHTTGKSCLYVTRLDKIDEEVLAELVEHSWSADPADC